MKVGTLLAVFILPQSKICFCFLFSAKGLVALSYAIYTNNKREYASLESSHAGPLTSARTSNLDNFLASPAAGCHSPLNSLPAHMATRAGMREKSLRNARSVSTRPRGNYRTLQLFLKIELNVPFPIWFK